MQEMRETQVQSLGWKDSLEKEMANIPLQYSCLGNPMDRGALACYTVHGGGKELDTTKWLNNNTMVPSREVVKIRVIPRRKSTRRVISLQNTMETDQLTWAWRGQGKSCLMLEALSANDRDLAGYWKQEDKSASEACENSSSSLSKIKL